MNQKLFFFNYSAGVLLLLAGIAKIISACGSAEVLLTRDPILSLTNRDVFWIIGSIEVSVALICLFRKRLALCAGLVAWLATNFLVYRCALWLAKFDKPCHCLGNTTDALHISPQTADTAMKIILAYLFLGSYTTLFWLWWHRKTDSTPPATP